MNYRLKERQSNIELLKVIAIFFIVLNHSAPFYGSSNMPSRVSIYGQQDWHYAFLMIYEYLGQLGDCIFLAASAFFLHRSLKRKIQKIAYIVSDAFFISVTYLIVYLALGKDINYLEIIRNIFSITCGKEWFVGCYLLLYLCFPILNTVINNTDKRGLLSICISLFFLYSVISNSTLDNKYLYTRIIGAVEVYFIVSYVYKYMQGFFSSPKNCKRLILISVLGIIISLVLANIIAITIPGFSTLTANWCSFINPFIIMCSISLLFYFSMMKMKQYCLINFLSSISLLYYIIYENYIFRNDFKPILWKIIYERFSYDYVILLTLCVGIIAYIILTLIATFYFFTIQSLIHKCGLLVFNLINNIRQVLLNQVTKKWE